MGDYLILFEIQSSSFRLSEDNTFNVKKKKKHVNRTLMHDNKCAAVLIKVTIRK